LSGTEQRRQSSSVPTRALARVNLRDRIGSVPSRRGAPPRARSRRGQSLLEFALVLPLLITVIIAGIDLARYAAIHTAAESASREATRYGSASGAVAGTPRYINCAGILGAAKNAAVNLPLADADITITYERWNSSTSTWDPIPDAATCPPAGGDAAIERMDRIIVSVITRFAPMVSLLPAIDITSTDHRSILKVGP
jgi:Flp pilus assembly protein TadG